MSCMSKELREALEYARRLPPMTEEERFEQMVSWVYGEMNMDGREMSLERVREIAVKWWAENRGRVMRP